VRLARLAISVGAVVGLDAADDRSTMFGPDGAPLATRLTEREEGVVMAETDPAARHLAKTASDAFGQSSRPDVVGDRRRLS